MQLSLAGWSLNRLFRAPENPLKLIDFATFTRDTFGLDAIELNNIYFESRDAAYLNRLSLSAANAGVRMLNIAVDERGDLSSDDASAREEGVLCSARWIDVAREMGIRFVRFNSGGGKAVDLDRATKRCIESFRRLADFAKPKGVRLMIENHWGISMDPARVVQIVKGVRQTHGEDAMGTLADFGNWPDEIDRYDALRQVMPLAFAVHAKVKDIDENLNHPRFDHARCVEIARQSGYDGYLGIEYEGKDDCVEGVKRGVRLLRSLLS
jgi:sugar phosphate isomerase/epimerase